MLSFTNNATATTLLHNLPPLNLQFYPCKVKRVALGFPVVGLVERTSQRHMRVLRVRRCHVGGNVWGSEEEGNFELESKILEFMNSSENPGVFPSKKELIDAGKMDLVEGIVKKGGWLCLGWDLDDQEEEEDEDEEDGVDIGGNGSSSGSVSSSGRSLEVPEGDVCGIEGILNRLEKQRSMNMGFSMKDNAPIPNNSGKDDWITGTSGNGTVVGLNRSSKPALLCPDDGMTIEYGSKQSQNKSRTDFHGLTHSTKPDTWRTWSSQRTGLSNMEFEAAEISVNETVTRAAIEFSEDYLQVSNSYGEGNSNSFNEQVNLCQIQSRLQHLKSELSSVLCTLKSRNNAGTPKDDEELGEESRQLSDAYEFQENEIMNARDKLRSIRAKLAVLEGKMALSIIDAQKMVEYKQKRIDDAHKALRLLRTACIVWTNSASEVLLAGSFDGWATQRKMEKSKTGIFSLQLKLYPGQYEIKFIVDGEWKTDPLRPIVNNGGYENNLLVIT